MSAQEVNAMAVAVNGAAAQVAVMDVGNSKVVGLEVKNSGANAFNAFVLKGRVSQSQNTPANAGNLTQLSSLAADYSTPVYPVIKAIGAPVTLAAGSSALIFVDVTGLSTLEVWIGSSAATTADIHASIKYTL